MADRNLRLQVILEGLDRVTAPLKAITGASSAARRDLAQTQQQLKSLDELQQQVSRYKAAEGRFAGDVQRSEELQAKLADLRRQLDATEKPTKKLRDEFAKVERQSADMAQKLESSGAELQQLSSKLSAAGIDVAELARHEDRLAAQTQDATEALRRQTAQLEKVDQARRNSEKLNDVSAKATGMGLGMVAAGTAAGAPIVMATKQAMTLESAMADVRKVVDFPTPKAFAQMSDDILEMSTRIPMSAEGIAQIVAAAGRANVPRQELLRFAEDAAKMGVAFDSTAEDAGATMAKWRTAFLLPQAGVVELADQINALTNSYGGNVGAVTEMVTRIGPLGKVGGLAASQIAAMSQVLSSVGVESEVGATGIKNMMLALTKGEAATKSQSKAFEALGLDAVQVAKDMQRDAGGAIIDVMTRLQKLPKEAQAGALTQLFGSESVSAIAPMLTSLDQLQKNFALVGDKGQYAGSMNKEYLSAIATSEGATGLATNSLSALNTTMGEYLLPTVVAVSEKIGDAANVMRHWAQEHPQLAKGLMLFMGVGAALLIVLGGLALVFAAVTAAAAPLAGILAISIGALLGWMAAIIAAVAAVAAAAYLIYENWGSVGSIFDPLMDAGQGLWASMSGLVTQLGNLFMALWDGPLGMMIRVVIDLVLELAAIFGTALGETVVAVVSTVMQVLSAAFNFIANVVGLIAAILTGDLGGAWEATKGIFKAGADAIVAILSGLGSIFWSLGKAIINGLVAGIRAGFGMLKATIGDVAQLLPEWVRKPLGIHSPSRVFAEIGGHVMAGLDQGIADNANAPLGRMAALSQALTNSAAIEPVAPLVASTDPGEGGILGRISESSGRIVGALAAGAAAPAVAMATPAALPRDASSRPAAPTEVTYQITIHAGGANAQEMGEVFRKLLEEHKRELEGREYRDR